MATSLASGVSGTADSMLQVRNAPPVHLGQVLVVQLRLVFPVHLQAEGIHTCRAPSCVVCIDSACFGPQV
jgi:hypothetical protein